MVVNRRRILRGKALQILYAHEVSKEPLQFIIKQQFSMPKQNSPDFKFVMSLIEKTIQHEEELDAKIKMKAINWEFNRISLIDRIILRMGICELYYFSDIPPKVTINELIEIAKSFSTDKSSDFINGILDSIYQDLKKSQKLSKKGRGLINESLHKPNPIC